MMFPCMTGALPLFYVLVGIALTGGAMTIRRHFPCRRLVRLAQGIRSVASGIAASGARRLPAGFAGSAVRITATAGDPAAKRRRIAQLRTALAELTHERGAAPVRNTAIRIDMALARNGVPFLVYLERDIEAGLTLVRLASVLDDVHIHVDQQHTNLANIYREMTRFDPTVTFVGLPAAGGEPVREGPGSEKADTGRGPSHRVVEATPTGPPGRKRHRAAADTDSVFVGAELPLDGPAAGPDDIDVPLPLGAAEAA